MPPNDNNSSNSNLDRLEKILGVIDASLTKEEFIKAVEQMMTYVVRVERKNSDAVDLLEATYARLIKRIQDDHGTTLSDMKGQVNDLFVTEQLKKIRADLETKIDDKLSAVKDGKDGAKGERGLPGIGKPGRDGSPDTAGKIRDKLETLTGDDRLDVSAIKGLDNLDKDIKFLKSRPAGMAARSSNSTKFYDLSAQTNGVLKVFTVPKSVAAIVLSSDFPTVLMEGRGFTLNGPRTLLTLTTDNPPSAGSQLLYQYSSMFN